MGVNPQHVRTVEFSTVKKGLDPDEVTTFLARVADDLESAQNHARAMEARARAAVQRAQELSAAHTPDEPSDPVAASVDEANTISRTLLLAQRTADTTLAEAAAEAAKLREEATEQATSELDAARELATQMSETAREKALEAGEEARRAVEQELHDLQVSRDALDADVHALRAFLDVQRERLRDAATTLMDLTDRVPGGIAHVPPPVLHTDATDVTDDDPAPGDLVAPPEIEDDPAPGDLVAPPEIEDDPPPEADDIIIVAADVDVEPPSAEPQPVKSAGVDDPTPVDSAVWSPDEVPDPAPRSDLSFNFTDE